MFNVTIEWTSDGNMISSDENSGRINITMTTEISLNHYQTQLVFSTLSSSMDSSIYECSVSIDSIDTLLYVEDPTLVSENTTVSVQGMEYTYYAFTMYTVRKYALLVILFFHRPLHYQLHHHSCHVHCPRICLPGHRLS